MDARPGIHVRSSVVLRRFGDLAALVLVLLAMPLAAHAQSGARIPRVGILMVVAEPTPTDRTAMTYLVPQALQELGYIEGQNLHVDRRFAGGQRERLVINLKTAKALGLTIPPAVLARADTVIE